MNSKVTSLVTKITVNSASFRNAPVEIVPTFINFFFGTNGTGKSTVANAVRNPSCAEFAVGSNASDIDILVYNRDFIENNVHSYQGMKGVYTLNQKNAEIQQQIDNLEKKRAEITAQAGATARKREDAIHEKENIEAGFYDECWEKKKVYEQRFGDALSGVKGRKATFAQAIISATPEQADLDALDTLYRSVYSANAQEYARFNPAQPPNLLDAMEGSELLGVPIVNSADTELARFFQRSGSTDWARSGHDRYSQSAQGSCPYCGRPLPDGFEEAFIASFDQTYQENLSKLNTFLQNYRAAANEHIMPMKRIPSPLMPGIDAQPYLDKMQLLDSTIRSNIEAITSKLANPGSCVTLEPTEPILSDVADMIWRFNDAINANNDAVREKAKKKTECAQAVLAHIAYELNNEISEHAQKLRANADLISNLDQSAANARSEVQHIDALLRDLRRQTVETDTAKDNINRMLVDSGMSGFHLVPKAGTPNVYEVQRPDGSLAQDLSEGERNFIAFLYFYQLVQGTDTEDGLAHDKVVVIDDPVTSMDNKSLFIVSALTRQMIEICRNAADRSSPTESANHIKQIFVLTHNAYFHREVTYSYVDKYQYASFFLVRKADMMSSVKLCDEVNPRIPTERINVNPVKNSYAALWEEYKELASPIPLMNVIRRILEYYFLQLCGYEGSELRQAVLVEAKQKGRYVNDEQFQLASAMLSYIKSNSVGMNDGLDYVEGGMSADDCKAVFKMIFDCMNQNQHYEMMMQER